MGVAAGPRDAGRDVGPWGSWGGSSGRGAEIGGGSSGRCARRPPLLPRAAPGVPRRAASPARAAALGAAGRPSERGPGWAGAGAGGAAPSVLLQPLERGARAKTRLSGAGTMNRSFHKSQTLRFYDCSAVEVKSKVSRGRRSAPPCE